MAIVCPVVSSGNVKSTAGNATDERGSTAKGYNGAPQAKEVPVKV